MTQDKQLYESDRVWNQEIQLGQKNLLQALADFMPEDASTILDVGCGDGKITQQLIALTGRRIVGLDSSAEALSRCTFDVVLGDATGLGFEDAAFDAVMTTDMLEHLPEEVEKKAWNELFRVAAKYVLVAVPFREELLDGMAQCEHCGTKYHVNWHMRSYDWPQLIQRAPKGWSAVGIVLTGEPWAPYHPIETRFRRELLNEWSGWDEALCPQCGLAGKATEHPVALTPITAGALGRLIYADLVERGITRMHSEILLVYRRNDCGDVGVEVRPCTTSAIPQLASVAIVFPDRLETDLQPFPVIGRAVASSDGGIVIQLPVCGSNDSLRIEWRNSDSRPLSISVEDGLGSLFSGEIAPKSATYYATIQLPRVVVPGYFGLLVRFEMTDAIASVGFGMGSAGLLLSPGNGLTVDYHRSQFDICPAFIQVTRPIWLDIDRLANEIIPQNTQNWRYLFDEIEQIRASERDNFLAERDKLRAEQESLRAERDKLRAEQESLRVERDKLYAEQDNLRAERDGFRAEQNNLRAERDSLRVERDNLSAERDDLHAERDKLRAEQNVLIVEQGAIAARLEVRLFTTIRNTLKSLSRKD